MNFYIGNNADSKGYFEWVLPPGTDWNKPSPHGEFEYEVYSEGLRLGTEYAIENPGEFVKLVFLRAYYLFRPPATHPADPLSEIIGKRIWLALYLLILLSLVMNLLSLKRNGRSETALLYLIIAALSLPFLLTVGMAPYRLAFMPVAILIAANYGDLPFVRRKIRTGPRLQ